MVRVKIFQNAENQIVELPKSVAFPETVKQVDIAIQGSARIITPAGESWDNWFDGEGVSDDFMENRDEPTAVASSNQ